VNKRLRNCPVCNSRLQIVRYHCPECSTSIEGEFSISEFAALSPAQQEFVITFICNQGNIKEVEKALGISYPTVKNRLQEMIKILCPGRLRLQKSGSSFSVLEELESGRITVSEAIDKLTKE
jgi:hypothetical protein